MPCIGLMSFSQNIFLFMSLGQIRVNALYRAHVFFTEQSSSLVTHADLTCQCPVSGSCLFHILHGIFITGSLLKCQCPVSGSCLFHLLHACKHLHGKAGCQCPVSGSCLFHSTPCKAQYLCGFQTLFFYVVF